MKLKKLSEFPADPQDWAISVGMGIIPVEISFSCNIGCAGSSGNHKESTITNKSHNKTNQQST